MRIRWHGNENRIEIQQQEGCSQPQSQQEEDEPLLAGLRADAGEEARREG